MAEARQTSLVIPAFDEEAGIEAVVRGLAGHGFLEVLVVDDGSTDATAARAEAAGARVVRHPYNKGNGAAVKTGIREARGDFVLLLILGFQALQWGILADLIGSNRKLIEDLLYRVRRMEIDKRP